MERPNYVIKTNEAVLMPVKQSPGIAFLRKAIWGVVIAIIIGSFLFQENLLLELSETTTILLVALVICAISLREKKEYTASPMELQFYDDYMVLYLPKRYYSRRVTRMEINKMYYDKITKCTYKSKSQRIHIYGDGCSTWYNYRADGTLPEKPTKVNNYKEGLVDFNTRLASDIDFKKEIEQHSQIEVIVEND